MSRTLTNSQGTNIIIENHPFNSGGEGRIHRILSPRTLSNSCVKIYDKPQVHDRERKLQFMVANPPSKLKDSSYLICWPTEIVYEHKRFVGFVMPLAFSKSEELYQLCTPKTGTKVQGTWGKTYDRSTGHGITSRLKLCVNIAIAVHSIHSMKRYVLVDLKPQNILVSPDGKISMIDLDSIQISQGQTVLFPGPVATPDYAPPEASNMNTKGGVTKSWDEFSLAIVLYQVLFGLHPYAAAANGQYQDVNTIGEKISSGLFVHGSKLRFISNKPKLHDNFHSIPTSVQNLFCTAFDNNPNGRPTAEVWGKTIYSELANAQNLRPQTPSVPPLRPLPASASKSAPKSHKSGFTSSNWVWFFIIIALLIILGVAFYLIGSGYIVFSNELGDQTVSSNISPIYVASITASQSVSGLSTTSTLRPAASSIPTSRPTSRPTSKPTSTSRSASTPKAFTYFNIICDGAPLTRLNVGFRARVTYTNGTAGSVRLAPASAQILGKVPEGVGMDIIGGPECDTGRVWWIVETDNGYRGWMSEGKPGEYWLEPAD
jgi:serine/threonine protein kinase